MVEGAACGRRTAVGLALQPVEADETDAVPHSTPDVERVISAARPR
ncbi:hypothetical protein ACFPM0_07905 [Pseudonocardia sulfidoxydans]